VLPQKSRQNGEIFLFMTYYTYVLYSVQRDRYYVGSTGDNLEERLRKHNTHHKGFTGSVNDWKIYYVEEYGTKEAALERERAIKSKKSRKYIESLK
jgi:putative endonuclease